MKRKRRPTSRVMSRPPKKIKLLRNALRPRPERGRHIHYIGTLRRAESD